MMAPPSNRPGYTPQFSQSATTFNDKNQFYDHVLDSILTASHHQEIIYNQVPPTWSESVLKHLDKETEHISARKNYNPATATLWVRIMPTEIHDCHQSWVNHEIGRWLSTGLLTFNEFLHLKTLVGTTIINFLFTPYAGAWKEPDLLIRANNQQLPAFVIESGWSESLSRLRDDMNLWLVGGNGMVNGTMILRWQTVANTNQVRGVAEFYSRNTNGIPTLRQELTIFPTPPPQQAATQAITLTRRMLFGNTNFQGRNPGDTFDLNLNALRAEARGALALMGLIPA